MMKAVIGHVEQRTATSVESVKSEGRREKRNPPVCVVGPRWRMALR
jgi:hypothetical protein